LDTILDGLADGLNEAVATAVKEAVGVAVEAVLREVLHNPELLCRVQPAPAVVEPAPVQPGLVCRAGVAIGRGLRSCWSWFNGKVRSFRSRVATAVRAGVPALLGRACRGLTAFARRLWSGVVVTAVLAYRYRRALVIAVMAGTMIGLGCYLAGPAVASFVSGVAGFIGSLVASALNHIRRVLGGEGAEDECFGRLT
jgi:hypothetical protein